MPSSMRIAILSDLHYKMHQADSPPRPSCSVNGVHDDPISEFLKKVQAEELKADYLFCPGDITDRAAEKPLTVGWAELNKIKTALGAKHLFAATGNHEVDSRASDPVHEIPGNSEIEIDPLRQLQSLEHYPSSKWSSIDRQWVYWGRGYEIIEDGDLLLLLINSSHFHPTTRALEFERGKLGAVALAQLRDELPKKLADSSAKFFIVLLHHPPVSHESSSVELGREVMFNGPGLIELLDATRRPWLVVHGHKHHGRVILAQGDGRAPLVFSAASAGTSLHGAMQRDCRLQSYFLNLEVVGEGISSTLRGTVDSFSWIDNRWQCATTAQHGIANGHGFSSPSINVISFIDPILSHVASAGSYVKWGEVVESFEDLRYLSPAQVRFLSEALEERGVRFTWPPDQAFPTDMALEGGLS